MNHGYTKAETDELPLYWAFMQMGAVSPDKTGIHFSNEDGAAYRMAVMKRRKERHDG